MEPLNKEKRIKREIANSNERRRMQSINAGFKKLKRLLPVNDGEKISKANILQYAADFITSIERDRIQLAEQNTLFRRILLDLKGGKIDIDTALSPVASPTPNSMLSVPLKLTMADLDHSRDSTPSTSPTPTSPLPTSGAPANTIISDKNASPKNGLTRPGSVGAKPTGVAAKAASHMRAGAPPKVSAGVNKAAIASKAAIALPLEVPYTSEVVIKSHSQHPPHHHHHHAQLQHLAASPGDDEFASDLVITGPRKLLKTEPTGANLTLVTSLEGQDSASKGQNLDTICKAIMEIEGGRVFKNKKLE